jgi:putative solute:sodium symporter small subunit
MNRSATSSDRALAWSRNAPLSVAFVAIWVTAAAAAWAFGGAQFLNLPIGAYLAGQGALLTVVLLGVRFIDLDDRR